MKPLFIILGSISLCLALLGIFLPILPTTPFLLLTAALYARSSDKLYSWLIHHPKLGPYILDFTQNKALPLKIKIISLSMLWITIGFSIYVVDFIALKILLSLVAIGVTIHILHFKTKR